MDSNTKFEEWFTKYMETEKYPRHKEAILAYRIVLDLQEAFEAGQADRPPLIRMANGFIHLEGKPIPKRKWEIYLTKKVKTKTVEQIEKKMQLCNMTGGTQASNEDDIQVMAINYDDWQKLKKRLIDG